MELSTKQEKDFYIVGIGTSAGGLEALERFFSNIDVEAKLAYVIVQHLAPDHKSLMPQLISNHTTLNVVNVTDRTLIRPHNIYFIPPNKTMTMKGRVLYLHRRSVDKKPSFTIDIFFNSLAQEEKEYGIGIILSGTGSDGTRGLMSIKEAGGMVMVQSVESAKFDGMPINAISTGLVDYISAPEQMPLELSSYIKHPTINKDILTTPNVEDKLYNILKMVRDTTNIDFSYYKRNTIIRRIERRMNVNRIDNVDDYLSFLNHKNAEIRTLQKELLIGVTKFFRDEKAFEFISKEVIPDIITNAKNDQIRIWIAGCSTGQEVYSLGILFLEALQQKNRRLDLKIFATDIDSEAVNFASQGKYTDNIEADVSPKRLEEFFTKSGKFYTVKRFLRDVIVFSKHNLLKDPPFNRVNFISCRNVMIYFQPVLQRKALSTFDFALNPEGYLFLGSSETTDNFKQHFKPVSNRWHIYRSINNGRLSSTMNLPSKPKGYPMPFKWELPYDNIRKNKSNFRLQELTIINELIVSEYSISCILVNEHAEFIRYFGKASKYIQVPQTSENWNIINMLEDRLAILVGTAIRRAITEFKRVRYDNVEVETIVGSELINLIVKPYRHRNSERIFIFIIIEEIDKDNEEIKGNTLDLSENVNQRINDLEQELKITRENLQATIEELQTSNEELLASNEELQSTNEELQSVNEELHTINAEHQANIQQLTELNTDVDNILQSTDVGIILLDDERKIRKLNKASTKEFSIEMKDLGRPLANFAHNFDYLEIHSDIEIVLDNFVPIKKEVKTKDNEWYQISILPYRSNYNQITGVIITLVEINSLKKAQNLEYLNIKLQEEIKERKRVSKELRKTQHFHEMLTETAPEFIYVINPHTKQLNYINRLPYGYTSTDLAGNINEFLKNVVHPEDAERFFKQRLTDIYELSDDEIIEDKIKVYSKAGEILNINIRIRPFSRDKNGNLQEYIGFMRDVTKKQKAEESAKTERDRYEYVFNSTFDAMAIHPLETVNPIDANENFLKLFGKSSIDEIRVENALPDTIGLENINQQEFVQKIIKNLIAKKKLEFDIEIKGAEGDLIPVTARLVVLPAPNDHLFVSILKLKE